jgi:alpha-beta hydrolase superfamily lysophospholipase
MPVDVVRLRAEYKGPHEIVSTSDGKTLFVGRWKAEGAKEFCDGIDCDDKELHVIPGARHAVWPKDAFARLAEWLEKKF